MNKEVLTHFRNNDPVLYKHMWKFHSNLRLTAVKPTQYFLHLARNIAFQQLNGKAASTIWKRFTDLFSDEEITPQRVLDMKHEKMRACGLSNAKASYIKNIAEAFAKDANYLQLSHLSDEEVIELLTKIKGVGKWTAEMFLMFHLGREDVFSLGDFGLKKGLMKVYKMRKEPSVKRINQITRKWRPYRTYGALALWTILDAGWTLDGKA